jgi:hypothetical protein
MKSQKKKNKKPQNFSFFFFQKIKKKKLLKTVILDYLFAFFEKDTKTPFGTIEAIVPEHGYYKMKGSRSSRLVDFCHMNVYEKSL